MATISEIRKRSGLVIFLIGLSIVAFIVSSAIKNNRSLFSNRDDSVGQIAGNKITYQEFNAKIDKAKDNYILQTGKMKIDPATQRQINEQAWNQLINDVIFKEEYDELGLNVSSDELFDFVQGKHIHPSVKQAFTDPKTGKFNKDQLIYFLKNLDNDQTGKYKARWLNFEESLMKERIQTKYYALINKGMFVTDLEAKEEFLSENKFAEFEYVMLPESTIPDSTVDISDKEIETYYNNHKDDYKSEAERTLEYVVFNIEPSKEDTIETLKWIKDQIKPFKKNKDDSVFIELTSDEPFDTLFHRRGDLPEAIEDSAFNGEEGEVFGPFYDDGYYKIAKLLKIKKDTVDYFRASHILIKPKGKTDEDTAKALAKARDLLQRIKKGESFKNLAAQYGEDGTSTRGGDLGWFKDGTMVPKFNKAVKNAKKGDLFVIKTRFGAHVVKVTADKSSKMVKVGIVSREVKPSTATVDDIYAKAQTLRRNITSPSDFDKQVTEENLNKRIAEKIKPSQRSIPGFDNPNDIIRWAYNHKEGDVSDILEMDDKYIIAHLTHVYKEGTTPLDQIKSDVRDEAVKQKKMDMLADKMEKAGSDINSIAQAIPEVQKSSEKVNFKNANISNVGQEPMVVGTIFGLEIGVLSNPIKGNIGVFRVQVNKFSDINIPDDLKNIKERISTEKSGQSQVLVAGALKDAANVKDRRYRFF